VSAIMVPVLRHQVTNACHQRRPASATGDYSDTAIERSAGATRLGSTESTTSALRQGVRQAVVRGFKCTIDRRRVTLDQALWGQSAIAKLSTEARIPIPPANLKTHVSVIASIQPAMVVPNWSLQRARVRSVPSHSRSARL
jgi:hypothetical protein